MKLRRLFQMVPLAPIVPVAAINVLTFWRKGHVEPVADNGVIYLFFVFVFGGAAVTAFMLARPSRSSICLWTATGAAVAMCPAAIALGGADLTGLWWPLSGLILGAAFGLAASWRQSL